MSKLLTPGERAGLWDRLGDLARRVARLEAVLPSGSGSVGIQFDTDNQGGWLDITANDTDGDGHGIHIFDDSGSGTLIEAEGGNPGIDLLSEHAEIQINDSFGGITVLTGGDLIRFVVGGFAATLDAAGTFTIYESDGTTAMFQMQEGSPDIHIQAGGTVVNDL